MAIMCPGAVGIRAFYALSLALAVTIPASCSTPGAGASKPSLAADSKAVVTVENLLRWSLEGEAGKRKVEAALHRVFEMKPLPARQFSGNGPVRLADGNVLSFAWIGESTGQIDIGVAIEPCVSPEAAAGWIGAQGEAIEDAHGGDRGKTYSAQRGGSRIEFTTVPLTYRCIDSINVYPVKGAQ